MRIECAFEAEVLEHLRTCTWPSRADADVRAHVEGCAICRDLVAVARALFEQQDELGHEIVVPRAPLVWWRAQVRARQEAAQRASRPMLVPLLAAAGIALAALPGAVALAWHWLGTALVAWGQAVRTLVPHDLGAAVAAQLSPERLLSPLAVSVATLALVVAAAAMFVMVSED